MEMKILNESKNNLFKRTEVSAEISNKVTPSKDEVQKLLSEKFSVPEDGIKVKTIVGQFGSEVFKIEANIYNSKEDKEKVEHKTKQEKEAEKKAIEEARAKAKEEAEAKKAAEEAAKAEAEKPAEENAEGGAEGQTETPKEENKEETKEEEKKE